MHGSQPTLNVPLSQTVHGAAACPTIQRRGRVFKCSPYPAVAIAMRLVHTLLCLGRRAQAAVEVHLDLPPGSQVELRGENTVSTQCTEHAGRPDTFSTRNKVLRNHKTLASMHSTSKLVNRLTLVCPRLTAGRSLTGQQHRITGWQTHPAAVGWTPDAGQAAQLLNVAVPELPLHVVAKPAAACGMTCKCSALLS